MHHVVSLPLPTACSIMLDADSHAIVPTCWLSECRRLLGLDDYEQPPALRTLSLRQQLRASRAAEVDADVVVAPMVRPPATIDVAVVGAGLTGICVAAKFAEAGVDLALLEKSSRLGGVWRWFGNAFSRVNSTEPGYECPSAGRCRTRTTPSTTRS